MSLVAIAGQTFRLRVELESQAAAGTFKSSPTVASGDVKILALPASPAGTETFANSTNAPTALNGPTAEVIIAAAETAAAGDGGEIIAVWADAAGAEWYSLAVHIQVKAADLPATGDAMTLTSAYDAAKTAATASALATVDGIVDALALVAPDNKPTVAATGEAAANVTAVKDTLLTESVAGRLAAALSMLLDVDIPVLTAASVNQTGDSFARLGAPAGANVSADVAAVKAKTDNLPSDPADQSAVEAAIAAIEAGSAPTPAAIRAEIDANSTRLAAIQLVTDTLDVSAVTQVAASSAGHLTITAGLTFDEPVTGLVIPADWEAAYWTLKRNPVQPDTAALVRLLVTNPAGESDGLQRLKGAEPASPITEADGTLTVTQATGRIDIWLSDELTACLNAATSLGWDVKFIDSAGDSTGRRGTADVVLTETHATA